MIKIVPVPSFAVCIAKAVTKTKSGPFFFMSIYNLYLL